MKLNYSAFPGRRGGQFVYDTRLEENDIYDGLTIENLNWIKKVSNTETIFKLNNTNNLTGLAKAS